MWNTLALFRIGEFAGYTQFQSLIINSYTVQNYLVVSETDKIKKQKEGSPLLWRKEISKELSVTIP